MSQSVYLVFRSVNGGAYLNVLCATTDASVADDRYEETVYSGEVTLVEYDAATGKELRVLKSTTPDRRYAPQGARFWDLTGNL